MNERILGILLLLFFYTPAKAQIDGLWNITKVLVGGETMTPVAKWSRFECTDTLGPVRKGSVVNGNGGIINFRGHWQYNEEEQLLSSFNEAGAKDDYGPFSVENPSREKMVWRRMEEGQPIEVHLSRTRQLPKAPWDKIVGLWFIAESSDGLSFRPGERWFIRWDRVFVRRASEDNRVIRNGIWHLHAHRPQLTLWNNDQAEENTLWTISFEGANTMQWESSEPDWKIVFRK